MINTHNNNNFCKKMCIVSNFQAAAVGCWAEAFAKDQITNGKTRVRSNIKLR